MAAGGASWALQVAITSALRSSSAVAAIVGNTDRQVIDFVPEKPAYPYVLVGDDAWIDDSTKTEKASLHTVTVYAVSTYRGSRECKMLLEAIFDALDRLLPDLGSEYSCRTFSASEDEPATVALLDDGLTHQGAVHFRALVQETAAL